MPRCQSSNYLYDIHNLQNGHYCNHSQDKLWRSNKNLTRKGILKDDICHCFKNGQIENQGLYNSYSSVKDVFERLTNTSFYTGSHKDRFDEFGNGRGLAGREYLFIHDGCTESPSRTHEVYSSVIRKPRKAIVPPGTLGVQKFGLQVLSVKLIWIYRNNDKNFEGKSFFIQPHVKTMEYLYQEITKRITPVLGPIRRLYDQNFSIVNNLEDLVDGAKYLCTSGEPPACIERLERFLSQWNIEKLPLNVRGQFYIV